VFLADYFGLKSLGSCKSRAQVVPFYARHYLIVNRRNLTGGTIFYVAVPF